LTQEIKQIVDKIDRREEKGKLIAQSRTIYKILGKEMFYVESESEEGRFYYIGYNPKEEIEWCSCLDCSVRLRKCKHIFAVENAVKNKTMIHTNRFPSELKKQQQNEEEELPYTKEEYTV